MSEKKKQKLEKVQSIFFDIETRPVRFVPPPPTEERDSFIYFFDASGSMGDFQSINRRQRPPIEYQFEDNNYYGNMLEKMYRLFEEKRIRELESRLLREEEDVYTNLILTYGESHSQRKKLLGTSSQQSGLQIIPAFNSYCSSEIRLRNARTLQTIYRDRGGSN
jgi:hypothetical protein